MQKSKVFHLAATKRILRYLRGTLGYGILFLSVDEGKECNLIGYINFSWCGDDEDIKLTTRYVFMLGDIPATWSLRKEPVVAL